MENHRVFWNYYSMNFDDVFQDEVLVGILFIVTLKVVLSCMVHG